MINWEQDCRHLYVNVTQVCKTQFHWSSRMEWPGINQSASATQYPYRYWVFLVSSADHSIDKQCKTPPNYSITGLLIKDLIWFQLWSEWLYHSRVFKGLCHTPGREPQNNSSRLFKGFKDPWEPWLLCFSTVILQPHPSNNTDTVCNVFPEHDRSPWVQMEKKTKKNSV